MLIVDTALKAREEEKRPVRVGMIGAGAMARGIAMQIIQSTPGMRLSAIAIIASSLGGRPLKVVRYTGSFR